MGLDAAGKTTILYKLKLGEIVTTIPTIGEMKYISMQNGKEFAEINCPIMPLGNNYRKSPAVTMFHMQLTTRTKASYFIIWVCSAVSVRYVM